MAAYDYCYLCRWWSTDTKTCDFCVLNGYSRKPEIVPCREFKPTKQKKWTEATDAKLMTAYMNGAPDSKLRQLSGWSIAFVNAWRAYHGLPKNDKRKREDTDE